jgi:site-specific recombinase XerC
VLRSTSKNSSRGFWAFLTTDVEAAAEAPSDAAAAEEKSRLPSALDRESIAAATTTCTKTGQII